MVRRFVCAVACLLAVGAVCGAQQTAAPAVPVQQGSSLLEPVNSPEMDALAAKLVEKIGAGKITSVVVVGGASPENKVSELGASLRDGLNDALARQAATIHVYTGAGARAGLKRLRVSEGMLYCNAVADWIAARVRADGVVTIELERIENGHALVTTRLFDERGKKVYDKKTKTEISSAELQGNLSLTEAQIDCAAREYHAPMTTIAPNSAAGQVSIPICTYCPGPQRTEVSRRFSIEGTVYLVVTVLSDGTVDDIRIVRPLGYGLDGSAIDALRVWRFKPGVDSKNHPAPVQVPVELVFALYPRP